MNKFKSYVLLVAVAAGMAILDGCKYNRCPEPTNINKKLTFQPDGANGKDALIMYISSQTTNHGPTNTTNYGSGKSFVAMESTYDGNPGSTHGLIQFNLSGILQGSKVKSAKLSLYSCPDCSEYIGGQYGHWNSDGNEALLQRVTSSWEENTVTWNTRPSVTTENQVLLPSSTSSFQDYADIDVTGLVQDMINYPGSSYGFSLSMKNASPYRSLIFSSSDHSDASKRPKLVIELE